FCIRDKIDLPAGLFRAHAKIGVFEVQLELFVEAAQSFKDVSTNRKAGATDVRDAAGTTLKEANESLFNAGKTDILRGKKAMKEFTAKKRMPAPGHLEQLPLRANQFRTYDARFGMGSHPIHQDFEIIFKRLSVAVQKKKIIPFGDFRPFVAGAC